jgi:hypothetical protein
LGVRYILIRGKSLSAFSRSMARMSVTHAPDEAMNEVDFRLVTNDAVAK